MQISVHYWTPKENHTVVSTTIAEAHTHMETLCMLGRGLVSGAIGVLPTDYSIWIDGKCAQAIGKHQRFINTDEDAVAWDEPLTE